MTDLKLDELKRIAGEATPGNWRVEPVDGYTEDNVFTDHPDFQGKPNGHWVASTGFASGQKKQMFEKDSLHIATFDPPTVLALIAKIEGLQDMVELLSREAIKAKRAPSDF